MLRVLKLVIMSEWVLMSIHVEIASIVMKGWRLVVPKDRSLHSMESMLMVVSRKEVTLASLLFMKGDVQIQTETRKFLYFSVMVISLCFILHFI